MPFFFPHSLSLSFLLKRKSDSPQRREARKRADSRLKGDLRYREQEDTGRTWPKGDPNHPDLPNTNQADKSHQTVVSGGRGRGLIVMTGFPCRTEST